MKVFNNHGMRYLYRLPTCTSFLVRHSPTMVILFIRCFSLACSNAVLRQLHLEIDTESLSEDIRLFYDQIPNHREKAVSRDFSSWHIDKSWLVSTPSLLIGKHLQEL